MPTGIKRASGMLALTMLTAACTASSHRTAPEISHLNSPEMAALQLPFSEAVRVGDYLFLSGQIGNRPGTTEMVPGGIAEETVQALVNLRAVLQRFGSSLDRLVKCTIFLADIEEWPKMNEAYQTFFDGKYPARSAFATAGLVFGARVEIDCIALVSPSGD